MRSAKSLVIIASIVVAVGALLWWAFSPKPLAVEVALVRQGHFVRTIDDDGRTRARERYVVSAPIAGKLQRVTRHVGDTVLEGDVIASILPLAPGLLDARERESLTARVGEAEALRLRARAGVAQAQANLTQAKADLERTRKLATERLVSDAKLEQDTHLVNIRQKELDAANADAHVAEHAVEVARAALREREKPDGSRNAISPWEVRSPLKAQILRVTQESESVVNLGQPIIELGDPSDLEVVVDVLTTDAVNIHPDSEVRFERWGGASEVSGRVRLVEPSAFTKLSALGVEEQRVNIVIDVTSPNTEWKKVGDGYKVDARIVVTEQANALLVPTSALFREQVGDTQRWAVFIVDDQRARKRFVEIGERNADDTVVASGLAAKDIVVVYPSGQLRDGVRVAVQR